MKISYCFSTRNRGKLLDNSLLSLFRQDFDKNEYEIIVVDDYSTEDIYSICKTYQGKMNICYIRLEHNFGWRDCSTGINFALRRAKGAVWAVSHPEVIISSQGLNILYGTHFEKYPIRFVGKPRDSQNLCILFPTIWMEENQEINRNDLVQMAWREFLMNYSSGFRNNPDLKVGEGFSNFICLSIKKENWEWLGGFYEFCSWGSVDPNLAGRRESARISDVVVDLPEALCFHQYHQFSKKKKIGMKQLESRPVREVCLPNLTKEHEEIMKQEIVKEEYWSYHG